MGACDSFCFANVAPVIEHRVPADCRKSITHFSPATPTTVMSVYHACVNRLRSSATAKMFVEDVTAPPSETLPSDHEQPVASGVKVTVTGGKAPSGKTWQDVSS